MPLRSLSTCGGKDSARRCGGWGRTRCVTRATGVGLLRYPGDGRGRGPPPLPGRRVSASSVTRATEPTLGGTAGGMKAAGAVALCSVLGFLAGASLPSPLTTGVERVSARQWMYVTPASEFARRSNPNQVKVNVNNKSPSTDEVQQGWSSGSKHNESSILVGTKKIDMTSIVCKVHSFVVLPGFKLLNQESIQWNFLNYKTYKVIVQYSPLMFKLNPLYGHRAKLNVTSGDLFLRELKMEDSGIYEVILNPRKNKTLTKGDDVASIYLDVQDQLPPPIIIQNPALIMDRVQLSCIVKSGKVSGIIWQKDNNEIMNGTHYRLEYDSSTLFIEDMEITDCGFYTCTVMNEVSKNSNNHILSIQGILFIHEDALVSSVIAWVSTVTSFTASAFIVYALEKDQVKIYWLHVTSAILVFHGLSLICQIIAFIIFIFNTAFSAGYRASSGIGCVHCLITIIYVVILFLHHQSDESLSFVSNCSKRNVFLGSEVFGMLMAALPIIRSKQNLQNCSFPYHALYVKVILSVTLYVCSLGLFALFHAKFSFKMQRNYVRLKEVKRSRQSKNEALLTTIRS
ncbi:uncharacterized protein [Narcine bancroftii]|uniref:uncharacterized protein n=1 Tax=Narcine bancroftii TaxID=1343680 RepID=UPI003831B5B9